MPTYQTTMLITFASILAFMLLSPELTKAQNQDSKTEVRLASEIKWQALNPARGDASPQAGTIWGDQTKDGESGFLVKFVDGFSSPPHIHNITYRGIVLGGALHNDDSEAANMWMPAGSWWTQPAGEVHITSARGSSIGYVEIQSGPYLVKPSTEAFDNGERPINVHAKNIIWLDASNSTWIKGMAASDASKNPRITFLWGEPEDNKVNGTMVSLPKGFSGTLDAENSAFQVVVVKGATSLHQDNGAKITNLTFGSYFASRGKSSHKLTCDEDCTIYIRTTGKYTVVPH